MERTRPLEIVFRCYWKVSQGPSFYLIIIATIPTDIRNEPHTTPVIMRLVLSRFMLMVVEGLVAILIERVAAAVVRAIVYLLVVFGCPITKEDTHQPQKEFCDLLLRKG